MFPHSSERFQPKSIKIQRFSGKNLLHPLAARLHVARKGCHLLKRRHAALRAKRGDDLRVHRTATPEMIGTLGLYIYIYAYSIYIYMCIH